MKNVKLALAVLGLSFAVVSGANANSYRYDFVPGSGSSLLAGSYIDFSTATGQGLASISILDYSIVTPGGTLTSGLSASSWLSWLSWNGSTLTITGTPLSFSGKNGATATFNTTSGNYTDGSFWSLLLGGTTVKGTWQAEVASVPDQGATLLLLLVGVGFLAAGYMIWRPKTA